MKHISLRTHEVQNIDKTTKIYTLADPIDGLIRYVGKADYPVRRLAKHVYESHKIASHKDRWIQSVLKSGRRPVYEILEVVPESEWISAEIYWISQLRAWGFDLVNGTHGGDGVFHTAEVREKIRKANIGKRHSEASRERMRLNNLGKKLSAESKEKMSAKLRGRLPWCTGKKLTPEHVENIRLGNIGKKKPQSREVIERRRIAKTGSKLSESHKANIGKAQKMRFGGQPIFNGPKEVSNKIVKLSRSQFYYAVVHKKSGDLLYEVGHTSVYLLRRVAKNLTKKWTQYVVRPILREHLEFLLQGRPIWTAPTAPKRKKTDKP